MNMYSWEGLSFITSAAGIPDHLHPETVACTNFDIAKVFVKVDLTKELPKKINYTIQGKEVEVYFNYPWLPPKCTTCGKWGHYATFCKVEQKEEVKKSEEAGNENKEEVPNEKKEGSNEELEKRKSQETVVNGEHGITDAEGSEEGEVNAWETVAQEKASRTSSPSLKYGQVKIITPSRYAALSVLDGDDEVSEQEEIEVLEDKDTEIEKEVSLNMVIEEAFKKSAESKGGNTRLTLPRKSKTNHRVVTSESSLQAKDINPGASKKGSRKNH